MRGGSCCVAGTIAAPVRVTKIVATGIVTSSSRLDRHERGSGDDHVTAPIRRTVRGRQAETVQKLMDAAIADLAEMPYSEVSSRTIAKRADVSIATFYTYFSSKDHLLAVVFRDRMNEAIAQDISAGANARERIELAMGNIVSTAFTDQGLQRAWTVALLADDPDVKLLQQEYAAKFGAYLLEALGDEAGQVAREGILLVVAGGLLAAGQDVLSFADLPRLLGEITEALVKGSPAV
jgi:AcrR family transcriptional regulator